MDLWAGQTFNTDSDVFFPLWVLLPTTAILPIFWLVRNRREQATKHVTGSGEIHLAATGSIVPDEPRSEESLGGDCFRCGYNLRGIADDQPCPECGLLAQRSRRRTDELHNTRPRWLRTLSLGITFILLGLAAAFAWPYVWRDVSVLASLGHNSGFFQTLTRYGRVGYYMAAVTIFLGIVLFTRPEGYAPADQADQRRRFWLRILALTPLCILLLRSDFGYAFIHPIYMGEGFFVTLNTFALTPISIALVPLPLLMFLQLRGLAKRARSAHLAEHCLIVGIGASAVILYVEGMLVLLGYANQLGFGDYWLERSPTALGLSVSLAVLALLMVLWTLHLLIRFAYSFRQVAIELRKKWTRDDLSASLVGRG